jgi:hypothetical protein
MLATSGQVLESWGQAVTQAERHSSISTRNSKCIGGGMRTREIVEWAGVDVRIEFSTARLSGPSLALSRSDGARRLLVTDGPGWALPDPVVSRMDAHAGPSSGEEHSTSEWTSSGPGREMDDRASCRKEDERREDASEGSGSTMEELYEAVLSVTSLDGSMKPHSALESRRSDGRRKKFAARGREQSGRRQHHTAVGTDDGSVSI